jgi:hypothetical protein
MMRPTVLLLLRAFIAAVTCLPSRCLATKGDIHFTEPFRSNDRRDTHADIQVDGGSYEVMYTVEIGSGAEIYIPSFINTGSGIQKLMGWGNSQKHRQHGDLISLLVFLSCFPYFQKKKNESRLMRSPCVSVNLSY